MTGAMIAVVPVAAVTLAVVVLLAAGVACLFVSTQPARPRSTGLRRSTLTGISPERLAVAAAGGVIVLMLTRWPVLALVAAALIGGWSRLLRDEQ
jgi:hypothetical protein